MPRKNKQNARELHISSTNPAASDSAPKCFIKIACGKPDIVQNDFKRSTQRDLSDGERTLDSETRTFNFKLIS